ncbi:hypothetical protein H8S95_10295 [Pontibacter sp. KCTC 32443]|uniref:hypothetical protein n=1 Tax=Pontibacter TaxID=323449 RepID=UPI00164E2B76|nr:MULTISPECIES: hypothetical protein [Pontibacter]MBC5774452.1 hypothetical protein [Pontibacter sp. KCTC 32443]
MKNFTILTIASALSLLLAGCSGSNGMQSSEYDDMYYSTADKTEYVQPVEEAYAQAEEAEQQPETTTEEGVLNPEYSERSSTNTDNYYGDEYYDGREYDPRDNWYRPNYSFVDPSWAYNNYPVYNSYSSYRSYRHRYADPFYDPFYYDPFYYDPFAYRPFYGSGLTIAISYNYGWGGYYGRYNPYCYRPYYSNYYGGYNHYYGGYYGHNYVYDYPRYVQPYKVQYGPRGERGGVVTDGVQRDGRAERGLSTEGNEQRATQRRPGRTTDRAGMPTTEDSKEVITGQPSRENYRPRSGEARPVRGRIERTQEDQQREQPVNRPAATETRPRREYRQEQRSTETRESAPRRETTRSYEQRETRRSEPAPSRSSSSGSSSESKSSGRPPRGN